MGLPPVWCQKRFLELCKGLFRSSVYEGSLLRLLGCHQADLCSLQEGYGSQDVRVSVSLQWLQGGGLLYWAITCKGWFERPSYHPVFTAGHGLPHQGKFLFVGGLMWEITKEFSAVYSNILFCLLAFLEDPGYWPEAISEGVDDLSLRPCE